MTDDLLMINAEGTALRKHQMKMLDLLSYVDDICRKNNINYWLSGGTLLGAVRHKGFIPWDDDLDIVLLRKDLRKLHRILKKEAFPGFNLQANDTDAAYVAPYEKLRMSGTAIEESNGNHRYYIYNGIYIDLFFWEPALPFFHRIANKAQQVIVRMPKSHTGIKRYMLQGYFFFLNRMLYPLFSFMSWVINSKKLSYPLGSYFETQFDRSWIYPLIELEFEGRNFFVPNKYDAVLKAQYGDYMKLPSAKEITFHTSSVKFEKESI